MFSCEDKVKFKAFPEKGIFRVATVWEDEVELVNVETNENYPGWPKIETLVLVEKALTAKEKRELDMKVNKIPSAKFINIHSNHIDHLVTSILDEQMVELHSNNSGVPPFIPNNEFRDLNLIIDIQSGQIVNWEKINPEAIKKFLMT